MSNPKYIKRMDPVKPKKPIKRNCLKCDTKFLSDGIHNRLCLNCQDSNSRLTDLMERIV